jgi:hypothetical protein
MILSVNAFAHKAHSPTVSLAFDAPLVNFTPTEAASAQTELSSMELNALSDPSTDASASPTRTGTELTVSASQDTQPTEIHVSATV